MLYVFVRQRQVREGLELDGVFKKMLTFSVGMDEACWEFRALHVLHNDP